VYFAVSGLEPLHRVEQATSVGRGAHEVGGLAQGLEVGEGDDDDGLMPGPCDDDLFSIVDDLVEDLGVAGPGLGVVHCLHGSLLIRTEKRTSMVESATTAEPGLSAPDPAVTPTRDAAEEQRE
jgi:hypothetical protein